MKILVRFGNGKSIQEITVINQIFADHDLDLHRVPRDAAYAIALLEDALAGDRRRLALAVRCGLM